MFALLIKSAMKKQSKASSKSLSGWQKNLFPTLVQPNGQHYINTRIQPLLTARNTQVWYSTSSSSNHDDDTSKNNQEKENSSANNNLQPMSTRQKLSDYSAKGVGQVIFLPTTYAGTVVLGSLAVGNPYLAFLAGFGTIVSTATALKLCLNQTTTSQGLYAYNGCLVGCANAVFVAPLVTVGAFTTASTLAVGLGSTIVGAGMSTLVTAALPQALGRIPQWTLAFNLVALTSLLRIQPLGKPLTLSTAEIIQADELSVTVVEQTATVTNASLSAFSLIDMLITAPLHGLSQIFVVESIWTGLGLVVATASFSPALAGHALMGSLVGSLTGLAVDAPFTDIVAGLWGYNSALTSMGVAVFLQNTRAARNLSVGGAVATALVFGGLQSVFAKLGAPCLTLPFCITMSGCYMLALDKTVPGLDLAATPHSPEQNVPENQ